MTREEGELPVVAVEIDATADTAALAREIKSRIGRALSVQLADVVFVRRGRLPKTTSGKVRRSELRRLYLTGELERAGEPARG